MKKAKRWCLVVLLVALVFSLCSCGGGSSKRYGAGGYEMPNSGDKSFSDYVKRVDPGLWSSMESNWGN